jgi:hypothetical protein
MTGCTSSNKTIGRATGRSVAIVALATTVISSKIDTFDDVSRTHYLVAKEWMFCIFYFSIGTSGDGI